MGNINVLGKHISELIAAGEVIERPASIVKELLENSIDAKSSAITIEIKRGGISYIRITDNGVGMIKEDVEVAFLRHATSKIKETDDLDCIATLGFRGEALASIAAVSRVEMTSKTADMQFGTKIRLVAGDMEHLEEVGCPTGTTIIVRDLFYNVPARLKFLKRDSSEGSAISGIIDKIALSHPEISFKLISDNKIKTHTPGNGDLLSAIHAVFGKEVSSGLIPIEYEMNGIFVKGYTSNTTVSRTNRAMQHFFVNARYVKSKTCLVAIEEGYKNSIMTGRYPSCVLNVTVPVNTVDVNVHPAKIEIRFINERVVFDAIYFAVKSTLSSHDILKAVEQPPPQTQVRNLLSTFKSEESEQTKVTTVWEDEEPVIQTPKLQPSKEQSLFGSNQATYHTAPVKTQPKTQPVASAQERVEQNQFHYIKPQNLIKTQEDMVVDLETGEVIEPTVEVPKKQTTMPFVKVIGELFKTYILFEVEDHFLLLDKHAAHERIIFEKLKRSITTEDRQILLKPIVVTVSSDELQALNEQVELIEQLGFSFDEFGNNSVIIREVPLVLSVYPIADIFIDIANKLLEKRRSVVSDIFEQLLHSIACRSAVKANDNNSIEDLTQLIKQVYADDEIRNCPHGRPVAVSMSKSEIEKKFGRI